MKFLKWFEIIFNEFDSDAIRNMQIEFVKKNAKIRLNRKVSKR